MSIRTAAPSSRSSGRLVRLGLLLGLAALAAPGCDLKPRVTTNLAAEQWNELGPLSKARLADLRNRQTVLGGRVGALGLPPGVDDPVLQTQLAELQAQVAGLEPAVAELDRETSQTAVDVEGALATKDKIAARRAVEAARPRLDDAYAKARQVFDQLEPRLPAAEEAVQRHLGTVQAEQQRFARIAAEGGDLDLPALAFQGDGAQLDVATPASKATLDRLTQFANTCPTLRATITVRVSKGDAAAQKALALARAEAVRAMVVSSGIPAERLAVAAAAPAAQPIPDGVTVVVTTPCAPAAAPPPPEPVRMLPEGAAQPPTRPTAERAPVGN